MEKYEELLQESPAVFKRLVGVKKETFQAMLRVYGAYYAQKEAEKKKKGGRTPSLSAGMEVLLMVQYYREYRTFAHLAYDYGVSESTACRVVQKVEKILVRSGQFALRGKKAFKESENDEKVIEYIVIDATECPIQRPKKNRGVITVARRNAIP